MTDRAKRLKKRQRRMQRGQTLVIFALSFTVLLGLVGLTIDVARAYDLYARMQRAAESGALAGVLYMPAYFDTIRPGDTDCAVSRALKETVMNAFGPVPLPSSVSLCGGNNTCVTAAEVSVCPVVGRSDDLEVTITQTLDLVLLSGLGLQPVTLSASGNAEYLPPVQVGARLNYFGDQVECYTNTNNPDPTQTQPCHVGDSGSLQSYLAAFNGPSELKENGDPFVYCEEGPAYTTPDGTTPHTAYNGDVTNHPQYVDSITNHCGPPNPGVTPGNPDQQPPGFIGTATASTAHPGAYNYLINVPQGADPATLWVYNPSFIPWDNNSIWDHFNGSSNNYFIGPYGNGIKNYTGLHDAPPFFYNITYSLYQVTSFFDRTTDSQFGNSVTYPPYDDMSGDLAAHGCPPGDVYDPYWSGGGTPNSYNQPFSSDGDGCFPLSVNTVGTPYHAGDPAPCWQQWCPVFLSMPAGTYRLAIEATGLLSNTLNYSSDTTSGYGGHSYALKICPSGFSNATYPNEPPISCPDGSSPGNSGLQIAAWNNMDVYFSAAPGLSSPNPADPSTTCTADPTPDVAYTCLDLACIPTSYAGRTLSVQVFDPGDGNGNIYVGIAQANVGTGEVTYPGLPISYLSTIDGDTVVLARSGGSSAFNGIWLTASVTLPANYTGDCLAGPTGTGWWQMIYAGAQPGDNVGVKLSLTGSPVHLLTLA